MPKETPVSQTPPYVTYASFKSFINKLRESSVPSRIDKTVMSSYSGSTQYALIPALTWLGLIDANGSPSDLLKNLSTANDEEYGALLRPMIQEKYKFLFSNGLDLGSASSGQVEEAFKSQEIRGSTVTKCISFFLQIAKDAKIPISPHVKAPILRKPITAQARKRKGQTQKASSSIGGESQNAPPGGMEQFVIPIRGQEDGRLLLPKDLSESDASKALRIIKFNLEQYYDISIDD